MSLAINRDNINNLVFNDYAPPPRQPSIRPPHSMIKVGASYEQYDRKQLPTVDQMGLDKKNGAGMRLRPDGKVLGS